MVSTRPLPGIPHHVAVAFSVDVCPQGQVAQLRRFRRCAVYDWHSAPSPEQLAVLQQCAASLPDGLAPSVTQRFEHRHTCAEAICQQAVAFGLAERERRPEQTKVRPRPAGPSLPLQRIESVPLRQWSTVLRLSNSSAVALPLPSQPKSVTGPLGRVASSLFRSPRPRRFSCGGPQVPDWKAFSSQAVFAGA